MYEQIVDQIRQAIWSGDLPAGTPLPPPRAGRRGRPGAL